jgi:FkbM family methyltransferase
MPGKVHTIVSTINQATGEKLSESDILLNLYCKALNNKKTYEFDDFKMKLDLNDRAQRTLVLGKKSTDSIIISDLIDKYYPSPIFWDIGANVGYVSLFSITNGANKVLAVEADPKTHDLLKQNCDINSFHNIDTLQMGISNSKENIKFHRSTGESSGLNSLEADERMDESITIQTTTIDSIISDYQPPDLIKVDVEGAEQKVLEGATRTMNKISPDWIIEVHSSITGRRDRLQSQGGSAPELYNILSEQGYTIYGIEINKESSSLNYKKISPFEQTPLFWYARAD